METAQGAAPNAFAHERAQYLHVIECLRAIAGVSQ